MKRIYQPKSIALGLAAMAIAATLYAAVDKPDPASEASTTRSTSSARDLSNAFRAATQEVLPSVVMIESRPTATEEHAAYDPKQEKRPKYSEPQGKDPLDDKLHNLPFGKSRPRLDSHDAPSRREGGMGSGVIYDASGLILTNHHVIAGSGELTVRLADGREFVAAEVWSDSKTDIAVIRIEGAANLVAATLGDSDDLEIGDWVLALGQPFGLESTVTAGIISAKHRGIGITEREDFLQTDAAINPGNSGGPLINLDGEVIGINTAISSRTGGNDGIGFAVPTNIARWVATQLTTTGSVERAYVGVAIQAMTPALASRFHVEPREGVLVTEVLPNTPASAAGLQAGDVVVLYAGLPVNTPSELQLHVERSQVGTPQPVTVVRQGTRMDLSLTPGAQSADTRDVKRGESQDAAKSQAGALSAWGVEVGTLEDSVAERLEFPGVQGALITAVQQGSAADRAGLESGMVITRVNRTPSRSIDDIAAALRAGDSNEDVLLLVRTQQGSRFVVLAR
ncbi:MAG: Do family serine endopeptidase [Planctomycetaceae bacterium]|nr:Do family serine endopeptidase [Planctomycetales bacterium]MCB9923025.1 Do family serine endopeptidase [Planctomycetaceae bacterium]